MNKSFLTVAQVFAILAAVLMIFYGILFFLVFNALGGFIFSETITIIGIVFLGVGALYIIAAIRLGAAKTDNNLKTEALVWSIILLFGFPFIGGIFGIIGATTKEPDVVQIELNSIEQQLKELENLFDKGLISREEYQVRRSKIIESV